MRHHFLRSIVVCVVGLCGCGISRPLVPPDDMLKTTRWEGDPCDMWSLFYSRPIMYVEAYQALCPQDQPFTNDREEYCHRVQGIKELPSALKTLICAPNPCPHIRQFMCSHALSDQALAAPAYMQQLSCPESDDFCTCTEEELGSQEKDIVDTLAAMCQKNTRP